MCTFVGEHNEIKGYVDLKIIAKDVLQKHENIYFLIAGKRGRVADLIIDDGLK